MKRMLAALLLHGATLSTTMVSASAHDVEFPNQQRAINVCKTQWSTQHPGKAITDAQLVACMKPKVFDLIKIVKSKASGRVTATKQPRIILTAMQNHQRHAQAEPTQRSWVASRPPTASRGALALPRPIRASGNTGQSVNRPRNTLCRGFALLVC